MLSPNSELPLEAVSVRIAGEWSSRPHAEWRGTAVSDAPVAAVLFLTADATIYWVKSERPKPDPIELRLALFPMNGDPRNLQVNFTVHGANQRFATVTSSAQYGPAIDPHRTVS